MPQVDIDQDVLDYIELHAKGFGQTPSTVLRRLLGIAEQAHVPIRSKAVTEPTAEREALFVTAPTQVDLPKAVKSSRPGTAIQRYMSILSDLYQKHPEQFEKVELIIRRKRIYFHRSLSVIEESGNSVKPQKIPNTPYYAATNLSDERKMRVLSDVLKVLDIHGELRDGYLRRLDPEPFDAEFEPQVGDLDVRI